MRLLAPLLVLLAGCPAPATPTKPDASDGAAGEVAPPLDSADRACAKLRDLGCALGSRPTCASTFRLPSKFGADPACVIGAGSYADLLGKCGVACPSDGGAGD